MCQVPSWGWVHSLREHPVWCEAELEEGEDPRGGSRQVRGYSSEEDKLEEEAGPILE